MDESEKAKLLMQNYTRMDGGLPPLAALEDREKLIEAAKVMEAALQADLDRAVIEGDPTAPPAWPEESAAGPAEEAHQPPARVMPNRHDRRKAAALARREATRKRLEEAQRRGK